MKTTFRLFALMLLCTGMNAVAQVAPFQKGDRVAFVGNSITDGGHYHSYIWLYYMTHFPTQKMWMANKGIGGDQASDILYRMEGDVLAWNPTVLTLTFGMNDTGYLEYNGDNPQAFADSKIADSRKNFLQIETMLKEKAAGVRKVMIGTSPYDQTSRFNTDIYRKKNDAMQRIVAIQDSVAKANNWEFLDWNAPMVAVNMRMQQQDSTFTIIGSDRVHPDNDGHMLMAALFLKAQGFDGTPVADVQIDARERKVQKQENCKISGLKQDRDGTLRFTYKAASLPMPLDTISHGWGFSRSQSQILESMPDFVERFSREQFLVKGLKGRQMLFIDGDTIGTFSAEQLAAGVNLALYRNTPQYRQAAKVMALNEERWDIERRLREMVWVEYGFMRPLGPKVDKVSEASAQWYRQNQQSNLWAQGRRDLYDRLRQPEVMQALQHQMNYLVDTIYKINRPVKHTVELRPCH